MMQRFNTVEQAVDRVVETVGKDIRLGLPLGLGKPNRFVNALYQRACDDPSLHLSIYTALSLGRPRAGSDLEQRFLNPFVERVFGDYEELGYLRDLRRGVLPDNVVVSEFFFQPGSMLSNSNAQQHYISSNYTHAARDLNARNINVVAQMVADAGDGYLSLSCNPEVSLDLMPMLEKRRAGGETIMAIGQLHRDLPVMVNDARVAETMFDLLIDDPAGHTTLFATPNMPVEIQDHFVGLYASTLLKDGGMIQIGIGSLGDALVHHAVTRNHAPDRYQAILQALTVPEVFADSIRDNGGVDPFQAGLYGCSEMITAGLYRLVEEEIIRRPVYSDPVIQELVNGGKLAAPFGIHSLDQLIAEEVIHSQLGNDEIVWLKKQGLLSIDIQHHGNTLVLPDGESCINDLKNQQTRQLITPYIGDVLSGGVLLHGGFFLGPQAFYRTLKNLSVEDQSRINMTRISYVNGLLGNERLKRAQRRHARFFNTAFTMTAMGAGVADQVEDGRVLSGVGGQYNFVAQAHELEGARSILMLRSWRERGGEAESNIVWSYGHTTIPRHLRDIVVTEYGIADLRGRNDSEVICAMLNITDSRFQSALLSKAQQVGKVAQDYQIPEAFRGNTPERLAAIAGKFDREAFPVFPLGCDFTETEQQLIAALGWLKRKMSAKNYLALARGALSAGTSDQKPFASHLERMGLLAPQTWREHAYRRLLLAALAASYSESS